MAFVDDIFTDVIVTETGVYDLVPAPEKMVQIKCGGSGSGVPGPCPDPHADSSSSKPSTSGTKPSSGLVGQAREKLGQVTATANQVKEAGKSLAKKLGQAVWDKLPKTAQKGLATAYHLGKHVAHALEIAYPYAQEMCRQIAKDKGYTPEAVERVGKIVAVADTCFQYGVNWVVASQVCSHLGVEGLQELGIVKGAALIPAASLAYIGASAVANPFRAIRAARNVHAAVKARHAAKGHGKMVDTNMKPDKKVIDALMKKMSGMDKTQQEWYTALLYTSLDETKGDMAQAMQMADAAFKDQPQEPNE